MTRVYSRLMALITQLSSSRERPGWHAVPGGQSQLQPRAAEEEALLIVPWSAPPPPPNLQLFWGWGMPMEKLILLSAS